MIKREKKQRGWLVCRDLIEGEIFHEAGTSGWNLKDIGGRTLVRIVGVQAD